MVAVAATFLFRLRRLGAFVSPVRPTSKGICFSYHLNSFFSSSAETPGSAHSSVVVSGTLQRASGGVNTPAATNPRPRAFAAFLREVMASGVRRQRSWLDEGWNSSLSVRAMWLIWRRRRLLRVFVVSQRRRIVGPVDFIDAAGAFTANRMRTGPQCAILAGRPRMLVPYMPLAVP